MVRASCFACLPPATQRFFNEAQLALYNGEMNSPMYLAILGEVYDVTKGKSMYGRCPRCRVIYRAYY